MDGRQRLNGLVGKSVNVCGEHFSVVGTLKHDPDIPGQYAIRIPSAAANFTLECVDSIEATPPKVFAMSGVVAIVMLKIRPRQEDVDG